MTTLIFSISCLTCCLGLIVCERKQLKIGIWVFKILASLSFILIALTLADVTSPFSNWMIVGFIWCFIGDILLIKNDNKKIFLLGIIAFSIAHLCFIIAFMVEGAFGLLFAVTAIFAILLMLGSYIWLKKHLDSSFKFVVPIYILIIGAMVAFSGFAWEGSYRNGVIIGATLFAFSDLFVAREAFVKSDFQNKVIGLPIYYIAQIVLALSLDW